MQEVGNRSVVLAVVQRQEYRQKGRCSPPYSVTINIPLTE